MKKFLSLLLTLVLCLSLSVPGVTYAATIKLNETKLVMNIGETYHLEITGTTKSVKWSSSDKELAKVSSEGKVKALDVGQVVITAKIGSQKYKCTITIKYDTDQMLIDTYNWVVGIWNDSFCDIYHYLEDGKDACGEEMDINKSIENADKYMEDFDIYDNFVKSLASDGYYSDLTKLWPKLTDEIQYLYGRIKKETPTASDQNYDYKYKNFQDYMYELMDIVY